MIGLFSRDASSLVTQTRGQGAAADTLLTLRRGRKGSLQNLFDRKFVGSISCTRHFFVLKRFGIKFSRQKRDVFKNKNIYLRVYRQVQR